MTLTRQQMSALFLEWDRRKAQYELDTAKDLNHPTVTTEPKSDDEIAALREQLAAAEAKLAAGVDIESESDQGAS